MHYFIEYISASQHNIVHQSWWWSAGNLCYCNPSSYSSSCEATAIIVLNISSLYGRSAAKNNNKMVLDYCSLEALDTNVSMVLASMTSWGRSFQSLVVLGRNEYCWYWVQQCGCKNCWLCLRRWRGDGGWSFFPSPQLEMRTESFTMAAIELFSSSWQIYRTSFPAIFEIFNKYSLW